MRTSSIRQMGNVIAVIALTVAILTIGCPVFAQDAAGAPQPPTAPEWMRPKNIIVMISDGAGFHQFEVGSKFEHGDQVDPLYGSFPVKIAMSTYAAGGSYDGAKVAEDFDYPKQGATDSAAAATAMATGAKTYAGAICVNEQRTNLTNATGAATAAGKAAGVITSVQLSHATPAGFVAHNESRQNYEAIAREMILDSALSVIMGAGHPGYDNDARPVEDGHDFAFVGGEETWQALRAGTAGAGVQSGPWTLVDTLVGFESLAAGDAPDRVLGVLPVATTLQQRRSGDAKAGAYEVPLTESLPSLDVMARGALNVLSHNPNGFFLMIEGGAVDWACHANQTGRLIEEQIDFNSAVAAVFDWVERESSWDETLLIVTADHETGYLTGPDAQQASTPPQYHGGGVMPEVEWHSGSHTNQLVPFFARGMGAEFFEEVTVGTDPNRGPYIDNTFIGSVLISAMQ